MVTHGQVVVDIRVHSNDLTSKHLMALHSVCMNFDMVIQLSLTYKILLEVTKHFIHIYTH